MAEPDWESYAYRYGPYVGVVVAFAFMFWIRIRPAERVVTPSAVFFSGNDPWYHSRIIGLAVEHFPATPMFDPWSYFPYGTGRHSGFGGLFDQLIALAALLIGGGAPSDHLVEVVTAYAPPTFGAITALPVYFVARRLTDRWSALLPVGLLALLSGQFLSRTVIGSADHQSAEAFFGALAFLGFVYAIKTAYTEKPTVADLRDRSWRVLSRPLLAGVAGGVGIGAYLMTWPPGVFQISTMGVFVLVQGLIDYRNRISLEYLAFGTVAALGTAAVLSLLYAKSYALEATAFSLLQPLVAVGVAIGAIVLYRLGSYWRRAEYPDRYFPAVVGGILVGGLAVVGLVFPLAIDLLADLVIRVYSFGLLTSPSALTVAEIQPASLDTAWAAFGPVFYVALVGGLIMIGRQVRTRRPIELLILLWSVSITSAYFTSVRFGYYLAVNVALLAGFAVWWIGREVLRLDADLEIADVEAFQIIGVAIVLIAVLPGSVVAVEGKQPVWQSAERLGGTNQAWYNETTWMRNNTPSEPLEYTELYQPPSDGDFEYPQGAYGVMSWWDYGHWITEQARRIPNANPFQQGPPPASAYFQAQNETRANLILEALSGLEEDRNRVATASNAELREIIDSQSSQEAGEDTRYVVIDDQMAAYSPGKFRAIATWTGPGREAYISRQEFQLRGINQSATVLGVNNRYNSMILSRLYFDDASGLSHYRLVHESASQATFVSVARRTSGGAWRSTGFINARLNQRIFNTVQRNPSLTFYDVRRAARVKVFERVAGARLVGSVDTTNRTTVFATVRLRTNTGRNFTYVARTQTSPDGEFNITVPYATDDSVQPDDGGTDSGVTALGNYTLIAGSPFAPQSTGNTNVPEAAVYDGTTIRVEMSPPQPPEQPNGTAGNQSAIGEFSLDPGADSTRSRSGSGESQLGDAGVQRATRVRAPVQSRVGRVG